MSRQTQTKHQGCSQTSLDKVSEVAQYRHVFSDVTLGCVAEQCLKTWAGLAPEHCLSLCDRIMFQKQVEDVGPLCSQKAALQLIY